MQYSEFGSDAHFQPAIFDQQNDAGIETLIPGAVYYFSGRAALYGLLQHGIQQHGWHKVYLPEYYCHEVDHFIARLPLTISYYDAGPYQQLTPEMIEDKPGNVIIEVNYFGISRMSRLTWQHAILIEDYTHDPFAAAMQSNAHYCFASLRKALPVPVGGVAWSPKQLDMPEAPAPQHLCAEAGFMKLSAMLLKTMYLNGLPVIKDDFRQLFLQSEIQFEAAASFGALPDFILQLIKRARPETIQAQRKSNLALFCQLIEHKDIIWQKEPDILSTPLGLVLFFSTTRARDAMKHHLAANAIYPAVLWPGQHTEKAKAFSDHMLYVHCDGRYEATDIAYMASVINKHINENDNIYTTG